MPKSMTCLRWILLVGVLAAARSPAAFDHGGPLALKRLIAADTTPGANALTRPVFVTHAPGDPDRLFIVEKRDSSTNGRIRIYRKSTGELLSRPFLTVPGLNNALEQGLLGLAFHPDYADDPATPAANDGNGHFYVYFTATAGTSQSFIRRYTVSTATGSTGLEDPPGTPLPPSTDLADRNSGFDILRFAQPQTTHNAGWMGFSPVAADSGSELDNQRYFLYISSGDGGGSYDTGTGHTSGTGNGQDTANLLGKILRLDVGRSGGADAFPADAEANYAIPATNPFAASPGRDEIFVYGLRNPWRCSFDRATGDLYIADVGQFAREEVSVVPAAYQTDPGGNRNLGWRLQEGDIATPVFGGAAPADHLPPILAYPRDTTPGVPVINGIVRGNSVIGGYVYRGNAMPWLRGTYFFADYQNSRLWSLRYDLAGQSISEFAERTAELVPDAGSVAKPSSFGEDLHGELYVVVRAANVNGPGEGELFVLTQDPYSLWKNARFTVPQLGDPAASGDGADLDRDGKTTIEEFAVGHDPVVSDGPLPLVLALAAAGGPETFLTLELPLNPDAAGIVDITGESGGSLADFGTASTTILTDLPSLFKFRDNVPVTNSSQRFGRFRFDRSSP